MKPRTVRPHGEECSECLVVGPGASSGHQGLEVNQYEEEQHGCRKPKKVQDPMMPSPDEVEEHNLTHIPFRSWCKHCIRGRGESVAHSRAQRDPSGVPELHMDYCFLGCKDEETQPIMVMRDRDSKMMVSFLVREGCIGPAGNQASLGVLGRDRPRREQDHSEERSGIPDPGSGREDSVGED